MDAKYFLELVHEEDVVTSDMPWADSIMKTSDGVYSTRQEAKDAPITLRYVARPGVIPSSTCSARAIQVRARTIESCVTKLQNAYTRMVSIDCPVCAIIT